MTEPEKKIEPRRAKSACAYCGDAPINHHLFYAVSLISMTFDNHILSVTKHAPEFMNTFVDRLLSTFFEISSLLRITEFSDDIDRAKTFRSRVIWEEAKKRGIKMEQVIMFGSPIDQYRAYINGDKIYFNSLPIPPKLLRMDKNWDDKFILKEEFSKKNIPVPAHFRFTVWYPRNIQKIFSKFQPPVIVKPQIGSRGRHTVTNIRTSADLEEGINISKQICAYLIAEEHLNGFVCRATLVRGKLLGFYRGGAPFVLGDGEHTIEELISIKDGLRPDRVEKVLINQELEDHILRSGYKMIDILPEGTILPLTHRTGRLFGGATKEMLDELHPSFIPIIEAAANITELPVVGFDCIVPDPTRDAGTQRWGIIECNTLPFIDLHYYALEGHPKNIAGAIWDMWK